MSERKPKKIRKEVYCAHPIGDVWTALTDPHALAEWLMPNNFEPVVGQKFRFQVDPVKGFDSGLRECEVLAVEPPRRLVYSWLAVPANPKKPYPKPITLTWTLTADSAGTHLVLELDGLEELNWFYHLSLHYGWSRMLEKLLPKVLKNILGGRFTPGAIKRRGHGTKTVPDGYCQIKRFML